MATSIVYPTYAPVRPTADEGDVSSDSSNSSGSKTYVLLILNIVIGSVGLISNVLVVVIIVKYTSMHKQIANTFIINQSVIDAASSFLVIAQMTFNFLPPVQLVQGQLASEVYCRLWISQLILWGMYTSSVYNLVVLTLERYLMIVHPILHKTSFSSHKVKMLLACIWLFGIFFQLSYGLPTSAIVDGICVSCSIWPGYLTQQVVGYLIIAVQYWMPLFTFVVFYTMMIRSLRRVDVLKGLKLISTCYIFMTFK